MTKPLEGDMLAKSTLSRVTRLFSRTQTPCYLPPSIAGNVPHLTPDNCSRVQDLTAQVVDFADISSLVQLATHTRPFRELLNVADYALVLSARDYISESNPPSSRATGFMIETSGGRRAVSIEEFMQATELLQPQLVVPLADEISSEKGRNRHRAAVQTSLEWLDACQALNSSGTPMCGVVVGGNDQTLRQMSAAETCKRDIQAVLLSGLGSCTDRAERLQLIDAVVDELSPASLPRVVTGIGHPLDVLDAVNRGIDAFVSPYPASVTKAGSALVFWTSDDEDGISASERNAERERSGGVLHLRESRYATDFGPLVAGCDCFACQKYTRAYIHHLLNVREMLGDILLYLHNLQHYYRFFREIRTAIDTDSFAAFHAEFASKFEEKLSTAPPLIIPAAVEERKRKVDAEKAATKATKAQAPAARHEAVLLKCPRP
ncbi:hypothetical protein PRNP1_003511 [Phytophthora ramorum]